MNQRLNQWSILVLSRSECLYLGMLCVNQHYCQVHLVLSLRNGVTHDDPGIFARIGLHAHVYGLPPFCKGFLYEDDRDRIAAVYSASFREELFSGLDEICAYRPYRIRGLNNLRELQVFDTLV